MIGNMPSSGGAPVVRLSMPHDGTHVLAVHGDRFRQRAWMDQQKGGTQQVRARKSVTISKIDQNHRVSTVSVSRTPIIFLRITMVIAGPHPLTRREARYIERQRRVGNLKAAREIFKKTPSIQKTKRKSAKACLNWLNRVAATGFVDRRVRRPRLFRNAHIEEEAVIGRLAFHRRSQIVHGRRGEGFRNRVDRMMDFSVFTTDRGWVMELVCVIVTRNQNRRNADTTILGGLAAPIEESLGEIFGLILSHMGIKKDKTGLNLHDMAKYM